MTNRLLNTPRDILRYLLVQDPIEETSIYPGLSILYAEGQPNGQISLDIGTVKDIVCDKLPDAAQGFRCGDGEKRYTLLASLDHKLELVTMYHSDLGTSIYDKAKVVGTENSVKYEDGILYFDWRAPHIEPKEGIKTHIIKSEEATLIAKKDPSTFRFFTPEAGIKLDENTQSFVFEAGKQWGIEQRIIDAPQGSFSLPGFREIPKNLYAKLKQYAKR